MLAKNVYKLKIRIKLRVTLLLKPGQRQRPPQHLQRNENSRLTREHQCIWWAKKIWAQRNWKLCGDPGTPQRWWRPVEKCKKTRKHWYVYDLDLFVTVQLLEETPAFLSLGKLCEEHGYTNEWARGQKPHLTKQGKNVPCKTENLVPLVVPGLSTDSGLHRYRRTHQVHLQVQQQSEVTIRHQETGAIHWKKQNNKKRIAIEHRQTDCETFRNGWRSSHWLHPHTFLMTQIRNGLQKWHPWSTVLFLTSRKIEIAKSACETTRAPCRRRTGEAAPRAEEFGDLITKSSTRKVNQETIIETQSWYKI